MSTKLRKLRIAFSVVCGIVGLTLIVLWVRSYSRWEIVVWGWGIKAEQGVVVSSRKGTAVFEYMNFFGLDAFLFKWRVHSTPLSNKKRLPFGGVDNTFAGFLIRQNGWGRSFLVCVPYWFLVPLTATFAIGPWVQWFKWHFSLRTLLIATTFVAIGLGLVVALR
jgi:hypothetical protein